MIGRLVKHLLRRKKRSRSRGRRRKALFGKSAINHFKKDNGMTRRNKSMKKAFG